MEEQERKDALAQLIAEMTKMTTRPPKTPKEAENHRKRMMTLTEEIAKLSIGRTHG